MSTLARRTALKRNDYPMMSLRTGGVSAVMTTWANAELAARPAESTSAVMAVKQTGFFIGWTPSGSDFSELR